MSRKISTLEQLYARCRKSDSGCIEYVGRGNGLKHRYGLVRIGAIQTTPQRAAWILKHGPIATGIEACHRCDNPRCCNVDHIFLGTHSDNMKDCNAKSRRPKVEVKLTRSQVIRMHLDHLARGMNFRQLGEAFGITSQSAGQIIRGERQKEVFKALYQSSPIPS